MLLDRTETQITNSQSVLSFETEGGGNWEVWDRYIAIEGKKAFYLGNICGTCAFLFERLNGANQSINPSQVAEKLNQGVKRLDTKLVSNLEKIIPDGQYIVLLSEISPSLAYPGSSEDYFSQEQVELLGINGFWGLPHYPKTEYYRLTTKEFAASLGLFEFLIPTFPHSWLDTERVERYKQQFSTGAKPTAVSLSVLDINQPADWEGDKAITEHWCLAHYLIDGHHKAFAAATAYQPLTLISFLATERGISRPEDIERLINAL